jgi:HK97 family phage prohead protease
MSRIHKVHSATVTSVKGKTVRALVSVYGNVDYQGDRVMPGAFTNTLAKWKASGDPIPVIWSHDWADPFAFLGTVAKATDTPEGLVVECDLDKDTEFSRQVLKLLETRRVKNWSFAYDVIDERTAEDGANELRELDILEVGPCLSGANPLTDTLSRKSVQLMLAAEAGDEPTWAGTTIPRRAVDDLRSKVSGLLEGFLDGVFDAAPKMPYESEVTMSSTPQKTTDPELARLNAEIDALTTRSTASSDAGLLKQLDELTGDKTATGNIAPETASVLMTAANRLVNSAVRSQLAGLVDAEALLMAASRDLRTIASGGEGDVAAIIESVRPLVAELRAVNPVAAGNLERTLVELAGGVRVEYVENEDRIGGSVGVTDNVTDDRDRYAPKSNAPLVDARFRPIVEPAAAVPVDTGETYHFPAVTTDPESYRMEQE